MGADFIEKAAPSFKKRWDKARVELATADLFTRQPESAARCAVADLIGDASLNVGDSVTVEIRNGKLVAKIGLTRVAQFPNESGELMRAVEASCSIAKGTIRQVHGLAGVVEISLC